jgi:hypothetical protein
MGSKTSKLESPDFLRWQREVAGQVRGSLKPPQSELGQSLSAAL